MPTFFLFVLAITVLCLEIQRRKDNKRLEDQITALREKLASQETKQPEPTQPETPEVIPSKSPWEPGDQGPPQPAEHPAKPSSTPPPIPVAAKSTEAAPVVDPFTGHPATTAPPRMAPASPSRTEPKAPSRPSALASIPWRDLLKRFHLYPPSKSDAGGSAEAQLAAWWTTRIGLILGIIAAVFFGIHVSQQTPPWIRVLTLSLCSLGTIVGGTRMKGALDGFGRAITAGGFGLLYFTAFAAFALPATKIIDSPTIGIAVQATALAVAILWALWKRDQSIATLTLVLGFVSCGFSHAHDLDHFAFSGIILLAAAGALFFATRGWTVASVVAMAGSWICFACFGLLDHLNHDTPQFAILLGTVALLVVIFEAGHLIGTSKFPEKFAANAKRWLILSNTTAAALVGYSVIQLTHSDQLSVFYFTFAALYFGFTAAHFFRSSDQATTETIFLKACALLAIGFAAAFVGPVRWLSISFQGLALLWTARRSHSRWIAMAFAAVVTFSLFWFWYDQAVHPMDAWQWNDLTRLAGCGFLVFLTTQLTLHSKWFPDGIGGTSDSDASSANAARTIGALAIGISTVALTLTPDPPSGFLPLWFLLALTAAIGAACPIMRRGLPCLAAAVPAIALFIGYAGETLHTSYFSSFDQSSLVSGIALGAVLVIIAFGISETVRRFWPGKPQSAGFLRGIPLVVGMLTLLPFVSVLRNLVDLHLPDLPDNAYLALSVLFPIVCTTAILSRYKPSMVSNQSPASIGFHVAAGLVVVIGGTFAAANSDFLPAVLAVSSVPLFWTLNRHPSSKAAYSGALPLVAAFIAFFSSLEVVENLSGQHAINLAILLAVSTSIAWVLWKKLTDRTYENIAIISDLMLHSFGIAALYTFTNAHFDGALTVFITAVLGLWLLAISRRFPFRTLAIMSWLPVILAAASVITEVTKHGAFDSQLWLWGGAVATLAQLIAANQWFRPTTDNATSIQPLAASWFPGIHAVAAGALWTVIATCAPSFPWYATALTGVALLCAALWRWAKIPTIGIVGLLPMAIATVAALTTPLSPNADSHLTGQLVSAVITAVGLIAHGVVLTSQRKSLDHLIFSSPAVPWLHAMFALAIAFVTFTSGRLIDPHLTTVFWGVSAIALFVAGLVFSLRPYRLTGLIGLALCIPRVFLVDIQDTVHRIIAFFAISMVLLAVGFLYHRFKDRISSDSE